MNWYDCTWSCRDAIGPPKLSYRRHTISPSIQSSGGDMSAATRIVLAQGAIAMAIVAWALDRVWSFAAVPLALLLLALALSRRRRRPRGRRLPPGAGGWELLALLRPGATISALDRDGAEMGVLEDTDGLAAIVRVGDVSGLLSSGLPALPPLDALLPAPARDVPEVRGQLLVSAVTAPPPTPTASAASYRQLTEGRVLAHQEVFLAVRARRSGGYQRAVLEQSLQLAVRRAVRVLTKSGLPAKALPADATVTALVETAQHDPAHPVLESWTGLTVGGLHQAVFRLRRWPEQGPLMGRLLLLPNTLMTLSLIVQPYGPESAPVASERPPGRRRDRRRDRELVGVASPGGRQGPPVHGDDPSRLAGPGPVEADSDAGGSLRAELVVRLVSPQAATLNHAMVALERLVESLGGEVERLDGNQLDGLAATLPLGGGAGRDDAALAGLVAGRAGLALAGGQPAIVTSARLAIAEPSIDADGLMLGVDRHGDPLVVRLFRADPTRAMLIGRRRCAQLLVLRALAVGAAVVVQSARPYAWEPFQRALGNSEALTVVAPGRIDDPPPAMAARPQLLVVDIGPVPAGSTPIPASPWRTVLFMRVKLTPADVDLLTEVDLALLQPMTPGEASLAGDTFGLADTSVAGLATISPEMVCVIAEGKALRWAHLKPTPIELQLTGGLGH
ncbi:hypothetical protein ACQP00_01050 [Dactylosporangium sp. CS-047395]|uniref:hypothetical protein n=1 Tax=Dactylosporangium sp. CS-047395 TaxID=3239936 RepID=UPI003D910DA4